MQRISLIVAFPVLVSLLAGCAGNVQDADVGGAALDLPNLPVIPSAFDYLCPPKATTTRAPGLCVGTIASTTESLQEPYVVVDPNRPHVVAIGVNAGHTRQGASPQRATPGVDLVLLDVHFSEDGGATWRVSHLPYLSSTHGLDPLPLDADAVAGDPALAFDEHGVLHVSGIVTQGSSTHGYETFYASTADLGRTWSKPVIFTDDEDNDRNWIATLPGGVVLVPWQSIYADDPTGMTGGGYTEVAWSLDGGKTWKRQTGAQMEKMCITTSPIVFVKSTPYLACEVVKDNFDPVKARVLRFELDGSFTTVAEIGDAKAYWPTLAAAKDGTLLLTSVGQGKIKVYKSADEGKTWSDPTDLRSLATVEDAWLSAGRKWIAADPWGAVHFILFGSTRCAGLAVTPSCDSFQTAHVAIDPASMKVLSEKALLPVDLNDTKRVPPSLAPTYGDHYYGLDFTSDGAFLVWTFDAGLDYTLLKPRWDAK